MINLLEPKVAKHTEGQDRIGRDTAAQLSLAITMQRIATALEQLAEKFAPAKEEPEPKAKAEAKS